MVSTTVLNMLYWLSSPVNNFAFIEHSWPKLASIQYEQSCPKPCIAILLTVSLPSHSVSARARAHTHTHTHTHTPHHHHHHTTHMYTYTFMHAYTHTHTHRVSRGMVLAGFNDFKNRHHSADPCDTHSWHDIKHCSKGTKYYHKHDKEKKIGIISSWILKLLPRT